MTMMTMGVIVKTSMRKLARVVGRSRNMGRDEILLTQEKEDSFFLVSKKKAMVKKSIIGAPAPPKGCVAVYVGRLEMMITRYVIPVSYFSSPEFAPLMEMTGEEFGFDQAGGLRIPCEADEFERVLNVMHGTL